MNYISTDIPEGMTISEYRIARGVPMTPRCAAMQFLNAAILAINAVRRHHHHHHHN